MTSSHFTNIISIIKSNIGNVRLIVAQYDHMRLHYLLKKDWAFLNRILGINLYLHNIHISYQFCASNTSLIYYFFFPNIVAMHDQAFTKQMRCHGNALTNANILLNPFMGLRPCNNLQLLILIIRPSSFSIQINNISISLLVNAKR